MNFGLNTASLIVIGVVALLGALLGAIRGLKRTLFRWLTVALSLITGYALTKILARAGVAKIASVAGIFGGADSTEFFRQLAADFPKTYHLASGILGAVASIPLFVAVMAVLSLVFFLFYLILRFTAGRGKPIGLLRLPSAILGAAGAVLVLFVVISPISCTVSVFGSSVEQLTELVPEQSEEIRKIASGVTDSGIVKYSSSAPFMKFYEHLTGYRVDGITSNLHSDAPLTLDLLKSAMKLPADGLENFGDRQLEGMNELAELAGSSELVTTVYSEVVGNASGMLLDGKTVFGVTLEKLLNDNPQSLGRVEPLFRDLLKVLSATTQDDAREDFRLLSREFESAVKLGFFKKDSAGSSDNFGDTIAVLLRPLLDSERTRGLSASALLSGVNYLAQDFSFPKNTEDAYNHAMSELVRAAHATDSSPARTVSEVLGKYALKVKNATAEQIVTLLSGVESSNAAAASRILADYYNSLSAGREKNEDDDLAVFRALSSAENFAPNAVSCDSLEKIIRENSAVEHKNTPEVEAKLLGNAINSALHLAGNLRDMSVDTLLQEDVLTMLGDTISDLVRSDTVPDQLVPDVISAIFQSSTISLSGVNVSAYIGLISDSAADGFDGDELKSLAKTISSGYSIAGRITGGGTIETKDIKVLLESADNRSIESIRENLDAEFFAIQGLPSDKAENISGAVGAVLDRKIASGDMTEEKIEKESETLSTIFGMLQNVAESGKPLFETQESANSFMEMYLSSDLSTAAVSQLVGAESGAAAIDPVGVGASMAESDRAFLTSAIAASNGDAETLKTFSAFIGAVSH